MFTLIEDEAQRRADVESGRLAGGIEEERSIYRQRAATGSLGEWWAQVEALNRSGRIDGERDGAGPAPEDPSSTAGAGGLPDLPISGIITGLLGVLQFAIDELGDQAVAEEMISDDLIRGDDSPPASDAVAVIPAHGDDVSRAIPVAVTGGWSETPPLSFTRVMRQGKARLTAGAGTIRHVVSLCDVWDTPAFEAGKREELEARARRGLRFSFVMVGVRNRLLVPIPVALHLIPR